MLSCFSHAQLFVTLWTIACQAPLSMGFSKQEYWSGLPGPAPGDLPNPGIESTSFKSPALAHGFFTTRSTWEDFLTMEHFFSEISHYPRVLRKSLAKYGMNSKFLYLASQAMDKPVCLSSFIMHSFQIPHPDWTGHSSLNTSFSFFNVILFYIGV